MQYKNNFYRYTVFALLLSGLLNPAFSATTSNRMNPAMSVFFSGQWAPLNDRTLVDDLPGFTLGDAYTLPHKGLSLGDTTLVVSGNADDLFYAEAEFAVTSEDGANILSTHEAYISALGIGNGLTVRAGRFRSVLGRFNSLRAYDWPFVTRPLNYEILLGGQLEDNGLRLAWTAPVPVLLEFTVELLQGTHYPANTPRDALPSTYVVRGFLSKDLAQSQRWQTGLSYVHSDFGKSALFGSDTLSVESATHLVAFDFNWQKQFIRRQQTRQVSFETELLLKWDEGRVFQASSSTDFSSAQFGAYAQIMYRASNIRRVGWRVDYLYSSHDLAEAGFSGNSAFRNNTHRPRRMSAVFERKISSASVLRLQLSRDSVLENTDYQFYLQYQLGLGPHVRW